MVRHTTEHSVMFSTIFHSVSVLVHSVRNPFSKNASESVVNDVINFLDYKEHLALNKDFERS